MQAMKMARPTTISAELILQITLPLLLPPHADNDDHDDGKYDDMAGYSEWATNDKVFLRYRDGLCTIFHLL